MRIIKSETAARKPLGAAFVIDTFRWAPARAKGVYGGIDVHEASVIPEDRLVDWPVVYILTNESEAYVGQTKSAVNRMEQHGANQEKSSFTDAHVIYCDEFNMSVITDYEHRLIELMSADGKYRLTNKNEGMHDGNYFSKSEYADMFKDLWRNLQGRKLVDKTIREIEESELFKYSPYKSLNGGQQIAFERILAAIEDRERRPGPIVVEGMPGTGKTVLAVYLLKALKDDPRFKGANIKLLEPVTSLRKTLRKVLKTVGGLRPSDVIGPSQLANEKSGYRSDGKGFDVVLVDESHRLKQYRNIVNRDSFKKTSVKLGLDYRTCTEVDWVMSQTRVPIFFYDPLQAVKPSSPDEVQFRAAVGAAADHPIRLSEQMRVGGGEEYLTYIQDILWGRNPEPECFEGYDFVLHDDFADFRASFERSLARHDLTRMVAGYAWPWVSKGSDGIPPEVYDIEIDGAKLKWNFTTDGWVDEGLEDDAVAHEVGCIHTIQGYDLSEAYVIIGGDLRFDPVAGKPRVNRESYFDKNGKNGTSDEELDEYIRHIYYVLLTRGIDATHVYICDAPLRKAFGKYFVTVGGFDSSVWQGQQANA